MKTFKNTLALLVFSLLIMSCETESVEETIGNTSFLVELNDTENTDDIDDSEANEAAQRSDDEDDLPGKDSDDEDDLPGKDS
ncbi:MAG: hypothetical protein ACJARZ_002661, partial [Dokdonia sp.]